MIYQYESKPISEQEWELLVNLFKRGVVRYVMEKFKETNNAPFVFWNHSLITKGYSADALVAGINAKFKANGLPHRIVGTYHGSPKLKIVFVKSA